MAGARIDRKNHNKRVVALLALCKVVGADPKNVTPEEPALKIDSTVKASIFNRSDKLIGQLTHSPANIGVRISNRTQSIG